MTGDWETSGARIVISSEVEKSSLQTDKRRMCESRNMLHQGVVYLQRLCDTDRSARKIEGNAFDDGGAKRYQNSAALPYFYAPHHHSSLLTGE